MVRPHLFICHQCLLSLDFFRKGSHIRYIGRDHSHILMFFFSLSMYVKFSSDKDSRRSPWLPSLGFQISIFPLITEVGFLQRNIFKTIRVDHTPFMHRVWQCYANRHIKTAWTSWEHGRGKKCVTTCGLENFSRGTAQCVWDAEGVVSDGAQNRLEMNGMKLTLMEDGEACARR